MSDGHFRTRAELERQMDKARQLRAETVRGAAWIILGLLSTLAVRRLILRLGGRAARTG